MFVHRFYKCSSVSSYEVQQCVFSHDMWKLKFYVVKVTAFCAFRVIKYLLTVADWWVDGWSSVLRTRQHSIGYMGDGFYRSKDPTNCIKVLKEEADWWTA